MSLSRCQFIHVLYKSSGIESGGSISPDKKPKNEIGRVESEAIQTQTTSDLHTLASEKLSKDISSALKGKFDAQKIAFDVVAFEKTLQDTLATVMQNSDIPFIAKRKFLEDVQKKVDLLSQVTVEDIEILRKQRLVMSLGFEATELSSKSEREKQAYYLQKILTETIGKYVTPTALGLKEAFSGEKILNGGVGYQKRTLDIFTLGISALDTKYGINIQSRIQQMTESARAKGTDLMSDGVFREIRISIIDALIQKDPKFAKNPRINNIVNTLKVNPSFQIRYMSDMIVNLSGQDIPLRDIIEDYRKVSSNWYVAEHEVRDARDTALTDGTIVKIKNKLGMEQLRSEFDFLEGDNLEEKMKNASLSDMIIIATQLATIVPVLGDIGGGTLDLTGAITGISTDGAKMGAVERAFSGVFGVLGIIVFGGWLNRARKAGKLAKLMKMMSAIKRYLPEKIESAIKGDVIIPEKVLVGLKEFTKRIPGDIGRRLGEMTERLKSGTSQKFPNTTRVLSGEQSRRVPKVKPEELSSVKVSAANVGDNIAEASTPLLDRYQELLDMPVKFNPKEGLDYIRKLTGEQRITAMKVWKQRLKEQLNVIADISTKVKNLSETMNFSKLPKEEIMQGIIGKLQHMFEQLSVEQRKEILLGIEKYVDKKMIVHKYAENPLYKDNPKKLIADAYGVDVARLHGDVTVEIGGENFTFYVHRKDDYYLMFAHGDEEVAKSLPPSGGFASSWSAIPELKGTIFVINGPNDGNVYLKGMKIHEMQHLNNQILMPDHSLRVRDNLSRAKDEIIAHLSDGSNLERIKTALLEKGDTALYDYYKDMEKSNPDMYKGVRRLYEQELITAIDIAHKMQKANIPNYLDILAITPVRQWSHLEGIYLSPHLSQQEKILKNIQMIFEKTVELDSAISTDINTIFGRQNIELIQVSAALAIGGLLMQRIQEEIYPEWDDDLKNNADVFFAKIRTLVSSGVIMASLRELVN